eukprot:jgi/Chlat1/7226/Chrsp57S00539
MAAVAAAARRLLCSSAASASSASSLKAGPGLKDFLQKAATERLRQSACEDDASTSTSTSAVDDVGIKVGGKRVYIETYGCQMNESDTEVVLSVLAREGYERTREPENAHAILINTCAIRESAESKIWQRLGFFKNMKRDRRAHQHQLQHSPVLPVVGVLGCMAERLKERLLETHKLVDIVVGPDAYRDLPTLLEAVQKTGDDDDSNPVTAMNVQLSLDETYADIAPVRESGATSAFVSVMRGCNNMCAFCVVPYTRGRERSREIGTIVEEVRRLSAEGFKEVTLLGQNVNSYADAQSEPTRLSTPIEDVYAKGFQSVYKPRREGAVRFAELLDRVANIDPEMRIRFTSPHPKDFPDEVLCVMAERDNVCKFVHMPAQSGSTTVLERMRRRVPRVLGYSREAYLELVDHIRDQVPNVALSSDFISGFCGETEAEHQDTLSLLRQVGYDAAFMFAYSMREKTGAARRFADDVPQTVKIRRLQEVIATFRAKLAERSASEIGATHLVLVEGPGRRGDGTLTGRTCTNKRVFFDDRTVAARLGDADDEARVGSVSTAALRAVPVARTTMAEFCRQFGATLLLRPADSERRQTERVAQRADLQHAC